MVSGVFNKHLKKSSHTALKDEGGNELNVHFGTSIEDFKTLQSVLQKLKVIVMSYRRTQHNHNLLTKL